MRTICTGLGSGLLFLYATAISSQELLLVPFAQPIAAPETVATQTEGPTVKREEEPDVPLRHIPTAAQQPILAPPQTPAQPAEPFVAPSQHPNTSSDYSPPVRREERPRIANTEALIYQRAAYLAQQRSQRLETRKWTGNSAQRPTVPVTTFYTDLNDVGWPYQWGYVPVWYVR